MQPGATGSMSHSASPSLRRWQHFGKGREGVWAQSAAPTPCMVLAVETGWGSSPQPQLQDQPSHTGDPLGQACSHPVSLGV